MTLGDELNQFPNETEVSKELENKVLKSFKTDFNKSNNKKRFKNKTFNHYLAYIAIVACLLILIPLGMNVIPKSFNYTQGVNIASVEKQADQIFGHKITIPTYQNYPIGGIEVIPKPNNGHTLDIWYLKKRGTKMTQKQLDFVKNVQKWNVLYGIYDGTSVLHLTYMEGKGTIGDKGTKIKRINGIPIEYLLRKGKSLNAVVNLTSGSYYFDFFLNNNLTQNDAFNMISQFLKDTKG